MAYGYCQLDKKNIAWMSKDNSCATLNAIRLVRGNLRGLSPFKMEFAYPITAIAGENGTGKSTLLAIVACAFHNGKNGFKLNDRKNPYYTFSDFFVQTKNEISPNGIEIAYEIRHDSWRSREPGLAWQSRAKSAGGRWSNYDSRVDRNTVYFGINRVVPYYERSTHKSYRSSFKGGKIDSEIRRQIYEIAGKIIGKTYNEFDLFRHSKYSLPFVKANGVEYSGFNMGAGEIAVFDILTSLFESGKGTLLVIDELELGLHEKAQRRLITELKTLCQKLHCQIVCSTHSHIILDELPPEGRFYIRRSGKSTEIIPGISSALACGRLAGRSSHEIDVFVEDDVAKAILQSGLPHNLRERIRILPIGSFNAVLHTLAGRYLEKKDNCLALLDGDQQNNHQAFVAKVADYAEASNNEQKKAVREWANPRITNLPGDTWPEKWLIQRAKHVHDKTYLQGLWGISNPDEITDALEDSLQAGKHKEFLTLAEILQQPIETVRADVIRFLDQTGEDILKDVKRALSSMLEDGT